MGLKKFLLLTLILFVPVICTSGTNPEPENLFPELQGFTKLDEIVSYTPETLFEYIDGAAELYLIYDFAGLNLQVYIDTQGNTLTAEIYDQQNVNNSFGIYSQERPYECEFLQIGTQANYIEGYLNFYQGRYYVKISGYNLGAKDKEQLISAGEKISGLLGGQASPPKMLKAFPETGKIKNGEEYIARDFLGYSFFQKAFTAQYEIAGASYKLFIIDEPNRMSLEKSIDAYKKQLNSTEDILKAGIHELDDPYQGKLIISVSGNYIVGILNPENAKLDLNIINQTVSNLK